MYVGQPNTLYLEQQIQFAIKSSIDVDLDVIDVL